MSVLHYRSWPLAHDSKCYRSWISFVSFHDLGVWWSQSSQVRSRLQHLTKEARTKRYILLQVILTCCHPKLIKILTLQVSPLQPYWYASWYNAGSTIIRYRNSNHFAPMMLTISFILVQTMFMQFAQMSCSVKFSAFTSFYNSPTHQIST